MKDSIMEEKARKFFTSFDNSIKLPLPSLPEEIAREIESTEKEMKLLSERIKEVKEVLIPLQKRFVDLGDYKYALQKAVTPILRIVSMPKKQSLLQRLEALSPERQKRLEELIKKEKEENKSAL